MPQTLTWKRLKSFKITSITYTCNFAVLKAFHRRFHAYYRQNLWFLLMLIVTSITHLKVMSKLRSKSWELRASVLNMYASKNLKPY